MQFLSLFLYKNKLYVFIAKNSTITYDEFGRPSKIHIKSYGDKPKEEKVEKQTKEQLHVSLVFNVNSLHRLSYESLLQNQKLTDRSTQEV